MKSILIYSMIGTIIEELVMEDYIYTTMLNIIDYTSMYKTSQPLKINKNVSFEYFARYYETQDSLHPYPKGIVKARTTGNCCWKIYQRSHFFGYTQIIRPGSKLHNVKIKNVKSFKKYDCY